MWCSKINATNSCGAQAVLVGLNLFFFFLSYISEEKGLEALYTLGQTFCLFI